jgi:hypothetical protein
MGTDVQDWGVSISDWNLRIHGDPDSCDIQPMIGAGSAGSFE